ncbi:MAG: hypothetical protein JHC93_06745 [Parachlamydiales bacterium]|nr:hypothetical protein [Parachlamydiales bacterium]
MSYFSGVRGVPVNPNPPFGIPVNTNPAVTAQRATPMQDSTSNVIRGNHSQDYFLNAFLNNYINMDQSTAAQMLAKEAKRQNVNPRHYEAMLRSKLGNNLNARFAFESMMNDAALYYTAPKKMYSKSTPQPIKLSSSSYRASNDFGRRFSYNNHHGKSLLASLIGIVMLVIVAVFTVGFLI